MLKFQLLQVQDLKDAAAIERRRRNEEERKKRIFNARNRTFGVDVAELDKQVQERHQRDAEEKKTEMIFAEKQLRDALVSMEYEKQEVDERKKILRDINEFRANYQRREDTREYDLNDPKWLAKSLPMRLNDDDPRCGISSIQKFEGEDLVSDARKKIQLEQTKSWLEQQVKERRAAEKELKMAEEAYEQAVITRDCRALQLDNLEKECRRQVLLAVRDFNKSQMVQQDYDKELKHQQELEDNFAEMYNAITSDFLTENPSAAESNFGPNRSVSYMAKGMTAEQKNAIRRAQLSQIEENKQRRQEEATHKKYWDDYTTQNGEALALLDEEMERKRREVRVRQAQFNKALAEEQNAYKEYLDKIVYRNKPTAAFYEQFNTSSR